MKTLVINIKQLVQVEKEPRTRVAGADMAGRSSTSTRSKGSLMKRLLEEEEEF